MKPIKRSSRDEPNFGFTLASQRVLRETDPKNNPVIQVFMELQQEPELAEQREQIKECPECNNYNLRYFNMLHKYYCLICNYEEVPENNNTKHNNNSKDDINIPFAQRGPYAGYDENDSTQLFIASINVNKDQDIEDSNQDIQLIKSSENGRVRHYKTKGLPLAALSAVNQYEGRR